MIITFVTVVIQMINIGGVCMKNTVNGTESQLLTLKETCKYLHLGETKCRELLKDPNSDFSLRIGGRWYAHRAKLDNWLSQQCRLY